MGIWNSLLGVQAFTELADVIDFAKAYRKKHGVGIRTGLCSECGKGFSQHHRQCSIGDKSCRCFGCT